MKASDAALIPSSLLNPHLMVYDTVYVRRRTPLLSAAEEIGPQCANGLTMLLHQAALSFERWFACKAPLEAMCRALGVR